MAKKIQDGNQIVTNVDSNDNLTFSIKSSFIDSTPTTNSTNLVTSGGVKSALDINTTDIAAAVIRIANNETNISNNTDDIEVLEDAVSTNTTNISTNTTDINNLETTVGTLSTNVNTNTTNVGTLNNLTTTSKTNLVSAINEINVPSKWVSVGSTAPTDGEKVWFKKRKNKLKLDNVSGTKNGLTYVWEGNKLTLDGTTTGATDIYNFGWWGATTQDANRFLSAGTYTLSIQGASNVGKLGANLYYGTTSVIGLFRDDTSVSKTLNSETYYSNCYISILSNKTFNNEVFYLQLEEGSTATTYEPYTENTTINVDEEELHFDNYSTDEQVIGKWIDGKPIYRKTYQVTNISSSNADLVDVSGLNIDTVVKLYGFIRSQVNMCMPMPLTDSSTNYNVIFLSVNKIRGRVAFGTGGSLKDCYVTIEYTKN